MKPDFETVKAIAEETDYRTVPVSTELLADRKTPIEVLRILKGVSPHCFILESVTDNENRGRYTFLGFRPELALTCRNNTVTVRSGAGSRTFQSRDPDRFLREILADYRSPRLPGFPPFTGGLVGYFSFDYLKYAEPSLRLDAADPEQFQDIDVMLFDKVITFDHYRQKIILTVSLPLRGPDGASPQDRLHALEVNYARAAQDLKELAELILHGTPRPDLPGKLRSPFTPLLGKEAYCAMVEKAKGYIKEGEIFQIVLSNGLTADFEGSLLNAYRILRTLNPSPYMFYFASSDLEVAGASPETLVKLKDGVLHTFPLAGTRPRGETEEEDRRREEELLSDPKELAEHNMLVDLGRNDIGRISRLGTVSVEKYLSVERFSHVMHLGSAVRGEIAPPYDAVDALRALLPAGTLSGAPKLRACQLINDLEKSKRGLYGGAVGYLDFTGNLDTCIAIRLAYGKNGKVFVRSGAGIVADSVPEKEYQECINKAAATVSALRQAEELEEETAR